jgi:MFS superfamily sulfate permease-like transporter
MQAPCAKSLDLDLAVMAVLLVLVVVADLVRGVSVFCHRDGRVGLVIAIVLALQKVSANATIAILDERKSYQT